MVLLLLTYCLLLLPLWESVIVLCFVVCYFMSILVLQSSWWGRESCLLCLIRLPGVSWWLSGSSSRCHGVVCGLWLWYFLIILTYYFCAVHYVISGLPIFKIKLNNLLLKLTTDTTVNHLPGVADGERVRERGSQLLYLVCTRWEMQYIFI